MNHKEKIGYTFLGAFIMLIGMLINNLTSTPVTDRDQNAVMILHGLAYVGGVVYTKSSEGDFSTSMSSGEHGGRVTVHGKDGKGSIIMDFDELGGHVTVLKKDSDFGKAVQIRGHESGGSVAVYGKASLGATLGSGSVLLFGTGGTASMSTNGDYPNIAVTDKEGVTATEMEVTEYGGRIDVFNKQGENRAVMAVNEYGNGAVSTWDKNGYRQ